MKIRYFWVSLLAAVITFGSIVGWHTGWTGWHNYAVANPLDDIPASTPAPSKPEPSTPTPSEPEQPAPPKAPEVKPSSPGLTAAGLTLKELGGGVYGLISSTDFPPSDPAKIAICNGGIVVGSNSVLVIDPFQNPSLATLMLDTVKSLTDKPVKYVLNTHYHFDHTGGNSVAAAQGIPIMGRGTIREFMAGRNRDLDPNLKLPDIIVNSESDIWLGDRLVRLQRVEGHSGGTDLIAFVPDSNVLFAGDIVFNKRIPYVGDGNIRDWQGSLYRLIATYPDATVVPGHGDVTNKAGMQELQAYFSDLERRALEWKAQNLTKEEVFAKYAKVPDAYKEYKFQLLYAPNNAGMRSNLEVAYDQFTRSATIPLIP
ncbi:MBL fold metallo-hydrolase [Pseudanabaena sp. PCC 6802]|uniref:MBL fold metallo-hydrolase n=1 Tax=Pseudanabaena sp. PCC 6802 TaxID=118173 RepID=UPI00034A2354|nr:MBL fold metallo-hydrolase [Pseudanabaena sp. PCC 6802]